MFSRILGTFIAATFLFLPKSTYREGLISQPNSLNPLRESNESNKAIQKLLFQPLVKYDDKGDVVSNLAQDWQISDDKKEYVITIRQGLRFRNGRPLDANDVLYTASNNAFLRQTSIDKLDDYRLRFTLPNPYSPFLDLLTSVLIVPRNSKEERCPNTFGPYHILNIKEKGEKIGMLTLFTLKKDLQIKKIVFHFYDNEKSLKYAAKLGEIDGFSPEREFLWSTFKPLNSPINSRYYALLYNLNKKKFKKKETRKALRDLLRKEESKFPGVPANGPLSFSWAESYKKKSAPDLVESELKNLTVTVTYPDTKDSREAFLLVKNIWEASGIEVIGRPLSWEQFSEIALNTRDFEAIILGQEVSRDPDRYVLWHSSQSKPPGLNISGFQAMRVDKALEEGRLSLDKDERKKNYAVFQSVLEEEAPAVFLYHPYYHYAVNKKYAWLNLEGIFSPDERFDRLLF